MRTGIVASGKRNKGYKGADGNGGSNVGGATLVITTTGGVGFVAGDLVIVRVAGDNLSATTPTITVTDNAAGGSNTYTQIAFAGVNATAAAGCVGGIFATKAARALAAGGTITVTYSGSITAKAAYIEVFSGYEITLRNAAVTATGASTAPAVTSGSAEIGDLVIGAVAFESRGTPTFDADTTNGPWVVPFNKPNATSGSDAACVQASGQHKFPTAAGAQTYNNTITSTEWVAMIAIFQPTP
jgi:hypothetical protein